MQSANNESFGSTDQFSKLNLVKPESVRSRLCLTGSYYGIRPLKLANGRCAWPLVRVKAV
jgi:hypothetical protein